MQALTYKDQALRMVGLITPIINDDNAILDFLEENEITPPKAQTTEGLKNRLLCSKWWQRVIIAKDARDTEERQINKGNVKKGRQIYCSDHSTDRHINRQKKSIEIMRTKLAINETGESLDMLDLIDSSMASPTNKLSELMVRMSGFEEYAKEFGHVGMFYTITTPSKYHKYSAGRDNAKHEHNPKEAQQYLVKLWSQIRASLARKDIKVYGFRVAEPHHDGTPHWHMLLFMENENTKEVTKTLHDYACKDEAQELYHSGCCSHQNQKVIKGQAKCSVRFDAKIIDSEKGSATGYIAKYIAKNIGFGIGSDSEDETKTTASLGQRVKAWASTWNIRQFQQIGGSPVTVWRELRRLKEDDLIEDELIEKARQAADESNWSEFLKIMGGADAKRIDQSIKVLKKNVIDMQTGELQQNQYEEVIKKIFGICTHAIEQMTRFKKWEIIDRSQVDEYEREIITRQRDGSRFSFPLEFCH